MPGSFFAPPSSPWTNAFDVTTPFDAETYDPIKEMSSDLFKMVGLHTPQPSLNPLDELRNLTEQLKTCGLEEYPYDVDYLAASHASEIPTAPALPSHESKASTTDDVKQFLTNIGQQLRAAVVKKPEADLLRRFQKLSMACRQEEPNFKTILNFIEFAHAYNLALVSELGKEMAKSKICDETIGEFLLLKIKPYINIHDSAVVNAEVVCGKVYALIEQNSPDLLLQDKMQSFIRVVMLIHTARKELQKEMIPLAKEPNHDHLPRTTIS